MKRCDAVMNLLARHGIRHLFHDSSAGSMDKESLLAAAARSGLTAFGLPEPALAAAAAEGWSAASGLPAAIIGTSVPQGGLTTLYLLSFNEQPSALTSPDLRDFADFYHQLGKALYLAGRKCCIHAGFRLSGLSLEQDAEDTQLQPFEESEEYWELFTSEPPITDSDLDDLLASLSSSRRPLLAVGAGISRSGAALQLQEWLDLCRISAVASLAGLDSLPSGSPLHRGLAGSYRLAKPDLVLALGCPADLCSHLLAPGGRLIVADGSGSEFNIDPRLFLTALTSRLQALSRSGLNIRKRRETAAPVKPKLPGELLVASQELPGLSRLLGLRPLHPGQRFIPVAGGPARAAAAVLGAMLAMPERSASLLMDRSGLSELSTTTWGELIIREIKPLPLAGSGILLLPLGNG